MWAWIGREGWRILEPCHQRVGAACSGVQGGSRNCFDATANHLANAKCWLLRIGVQTRIRN
jgi:hypothetical protein